MRGKKLLATLALSVVLFTGCGLKSANTIIKVNDQKITQAQFDESFNKQINNSMFAQMGVDMKNGKNSFLTNLIKERVVNELIVRAILDQEMKKRDIKVSNEDTEKALKEIIDKVGSKEQLDAILKQNNVSPAEFKKDLAEQVKIKKLSAQLGVAETSDAEAKDFYKKNIAKFKFTDKVRASHILLSANPDELKEAIRSESANKDLNDAELNAKVAEQINAKQAKAQELLAQLRKDPTQFAKIAKENSEDKTTAVKGGDLGFFAQGEMVPEFSKAAFVLKPNSLSGIVKTQFGYHIIFVTDRMAAGQEPFEKVKNDIKSYLGNQKQLASIDNLIESVKKNASIEFVNPEYDPKTIQKGIQDQMKEEGKFREQESKNKGAETVKTPAPAKK